MNEETTPNFLQRMVTKRNEGGFTLIELLIVIIILAVLAAIVVFAVGATSQNAVAASCNADAKSVETAVESYHAQTTSFPTAMTDLLTSSVLTINNVTTTVGPWLRAAPSSTHYIIAIDNAGVVYAAPPTASPPTQGIYNYDTHPDICAKYT